MTEETPPRVIEDRLRLEIGAFGATIDTTLRIDQTPALKGTETSGEDDLALTNAKGLPQLELTLLPGKRNLIRLSSMSLRRSAQTRLSRTIVFDDQVYLANERVSSTLDLALFGLTYGYQFIKNDAFDLAATIGVQIAELEANAVVTSRVLRDAESGVAPLPMLGVEGRAFFGRRWSIEGRIQYLKVDINEVAGSFLDARLSALWRVNPHLAAGLGYRYFNLGVDSRDAGNPGKVDLSIAGPMLFMQASL
ncbi:MAG: hypothetical protein ABL964_03235 [Steroidobacteraceae bacterium]